MTLLPTPNGRNSNDGETPASWLARQQRQHGTWPGAGPRGVGTPPPATAADRHAAGKRCLDDAIALLPTPRATDGTKGGPGQHGSSGDLMLPSAVHLLPTPTATDSRESRNATAARSGPKPTTNTTGWPLTDVAHADRWGRYAAAIARWEHILGRPAPDPTELNVRGKPRLSPRLVEWMMGLPDGWVTAPDIWSHHTRPAGIRNAQLRILGNGVVPQQATTALQHPPTHPCGDLT